MNKQLLIVLLAVCLVSTHAFVKRDAPAFPTAAEVQAQLDFAKTQLTDLINKLSEDVNKNFDPDTIKKNFNEFVDSAAKAMQSLKPATEVKPAA